MGVIDNALDVIIEEALVGAPPAYESLYPIAPPSCCWNPSQPDVIIQRQVVETGPGQLACRYERHAMSLLAEHLGELILELARDRCGACEVNEGCPYVHMVGYRAGRPTRVYAQRYDNVSDLVTHHFNTVLETCLHRSLIPTFVRLVQLLHAKASGQQQPGRAGELYLVQFVSDWLLGTDWRDFVNRTRLESAVHVYVRCRSGI